MRPLPKESNGRKYFFYLNTFYNWQKTNYVSGNAKLLYYEILGLFNEAKWPESIQLDNYRLMLMVDTRTERVAIAARDKLVKLGFIKYRKGHKGSPNEYILAEYTPQKVSINDSVSVSESDSESVSVSVSQKCRHIKTLEEDLDKDNISPKSPQGESESFLRFWEAYPRKMNRPMAWRAWEQLCPAEGLTAVIMAAVQEQSQSAQWQQEAGRYIPSPEKWLRNRRWQEKLAPASRKGMAEKSYDIREIMELCQFNLPKNL